MLSPWRCPLPLEEYTMSQVIVYFYSGRWVPIMFCSLEKAIALHHRAILEGREIFAFSPEVSPGDGTCNTLLTPLHGHHSITTADKNYALKR